MAEIVKIKELNSDTFEFQDYSTKDDNLIPSLDIATSFDPSTDYLEYFVLDLNNEIQFSNTSGFPNYTLLDNQISIDPEANLRSAGFSEGSYNTHYNFLSNKLGSNSFTNYYISEISTDRTELRIESTQLSDEEIISSTSDFIKELSSNQSAYPDFYLNFNNNQLVIANNIELDGSTVLIKLYEPLPSSFGLKSELWVVEKVAESKSYNISITQTFDASDDNITLQGPNLNIDVKDNINNSTEYKSFSDLTSTSTSQGSGSFLYQINNKLKSTGLSINIDYTDYSNFIHFSSAKTRLENFYYKLSLIEEYTVSASYSDNPSSGSYYVSSSNNIWQSKINELIEGFDGYEYHLYFNSGSTSWPKTGAIPPYINEPTDNPGTGYSWFVTQSLTAENYDLQNNNALINTVPEYLREDPNNANYELFVEMIGQQFDNIYLYLKDVTNKFNADNRLNSGVSKDLVADAIRDLGVKIYQNNFSADDVYTALIGIDPTGNLFGLPNTTGSLPSPAGYEHITTYVTASSTSSLYPIDDINKSIYKRIYHNLPYLLKKKGTIEGVRALITTFGIPDTILRVNEFGGKDKDLNTWDYWQNEYNYKLDTITTESFINTRFGLNTLWNSLDNKPSSIQFRFNAGLAANAPASQSLWSLDNGSTVKAVLEYDTILPTTSGSYSGSIIASGSQYATLKFTVDNFNTSTSVYLPFYNNDWWSIQINRTDNSSFELIAGNKIYSGNNGSQIGFIASSSMTGVDPANWQGGTTSYFSTENGGGITGYSNFTGSYQEIKYFNQPISQSVFKDYVMNPQSIEGNGVNGSYDQLVFRLPLGGELYTGSTSIHPKITGSSITQSFASDSLAEITSGSFTSNKEYQYVDQLVSGIKNRNSHKIKTTNVILPTSSSQDNIPNADVLSAFKSVQQNTYVSESYTKDVDYVEVAFSPQNEINDDISNQLGYINIGEYIGDPRQISSSSTLYPDLNTLRNDYFKKYTHNYDVWDYVRLIKYFDNSLFKMIKDWVPSRTSLAAGVVIKQHLLERNKYPTPQATKEQDDYYTGSISVSTITGSNGGSMPELFGATSSAILASGSITQSWSGINQTISGSISYTHIDQSEFFNGELSGSSIVVTDGDLMDCNVNLVELFTDNGVGNPIVGVNFKFKSDKSYFLEVIATNSTAVPDLPFQLIDRTTSKQFYRSRTLGIGEDFRITFLIDNFTINGKEMDTPFLTLSPTAPVNGYRFDIIVYENQISDDCLVLKGNATSNRSNTFYYDVDYSDNAVTAVNLENILSGSDGNATKATVPDSNYTTKAIINSRYVGKELTAANTNIWTEGDTSYGKSVTVGNPQTYFAYFNWVGGTSPEWGNHLSDRTAANIKYYIDENGDIIDPINDSEKLNLGIARQTFEEDKNAIIALDSDDEFGVNLGALNAEWPVFKSGYTISPILYTQTASYDANGDVIEFGYTTSLNFVNSDLSPVAGTDDYQLLTYAESGQSYTRFTSTPSTITFKTASILGDSASFNLGTDIYQPTTSPSSSGVVLTIQASIEALQTGDATVTYAIQNSGGTDLKTFQINHKNTTQANFSFIDSNALDSSTYKLVVKDFEQGDTQTGEPVEIFLTPNTFLRVFQSPLPGSGVATSFWEVSSSRNFIKADDTSVVGLNNFYGQQQKDIPRSGFNPITLPFQLQIGDEIRFEGTETLSFNIKDVTTNATGALLLELDREIPSGSRTDFFLVRRYIDDPSYIIMNVDKPAGPSSGGILKPQYLSSRVESNLDTILKDLQDKDLI